MTGLIEALGGPATPGVGSSIGLDRSMMVLEERGAAGPDARGGVFVVAMEGTRRDALSLTRALRREFAVDCDLETRGFGAQMKGAGKSGARLAVLLGEEEWKRGEVVVKDLERGEQETVPRERLAVTLRERLAAPRVAGATP
jgi:histidyl-tRNA synthetase